MTTPSRTVADNAGDSLAAMNTIAQALGIDSDAIVILAVQLGDEHPDYSTAQVTLLALAEAVTLGREGK